MRIIGGKLAGRCYESRGFKGRPTTDRAKQALFNIIANRYDFQSLRVLELYAGTGAVGFEFLSRGSDVVFVESAERHAREIVRNAKEFGLENVRVVTSRVERYLEKASETFDLIFADPPYDLPFMQELPRRVAELNLLSEHGVLIIEHRERTTMEVQPSEERRYGDTVFSFYPSLRAV